jgi:excinuclease UvrABC nuclease subunit
MKATEKFHPYQENHKTNLAKFKGKSGVYIIYERGKLVYVGQSGYDLYKTISRHFQSWKDFRQVRATYPQSKTIKVRIFLCSKKKAMSLEKKLIAKYNPRDCSHKYPETLPYQGDINNEVTEVIDYELAPF